MKKYFLITLVIILSCTRNLVKITPEYQNKSIDADKLFIRFVPEQPVIEVNNDLLSSLGTGSQNEIYLSYFEKNLPKFVQQNSSFQQARITLQEYQYDERELFINTKDKILIKIPLHPQNEMLIEDDAGYTLFLEDIEIQNTEGSNDLMIPVDDNLIYIGGNEPAIIQQGKFLIWDNNQKRQVSFGEIDVRTKVKKNQVEETWADANNALFKYLFTDSPFQKQKQ